MRAISNMEKLMDRASFTMESIHIEESLETIASTEKVKSGETDSASRVVSRTERGREEFTNMAVASTRETSRTTSSQARDNCKIKMDLSTKAPSATASSTATANFDGPMALNTAATTREVSARATASSSVSATLASPRAYGAKVH